MKSGRDGAIESTRQSLLASGMPRLQMCVIVLATGLVGLLASFALLHLGLAWMWLRYPLAILVAYGAFLGLLRLWLWLHQPDSSRADLADLVDGADLADLAELPSGATSSPSFSFGGGGDFGGRGATETWAGVAGEHAPKSSGGGGGFLDSLDPDVDGLLVVLAVIAAIAASAIAACYVVYVAPVLLAEILVDAMLVAGLYRKLRRTEQRYWLWTAVRWTWAPTLALALFFVGLGVFLQLLAPEARSLGEVWSEVRGERR
jgi:hypothetical protein